jgi:hypothetical protein
MSDIEWVFASSEPAEEFAQLHFYSIKKQQGDRTIEFRITVHEYGERNQLKMRFFAQADKQLNQKIAPFFPFGWGDSLLEALRECVASIRRFPYQGE